MPESITESDHANSYEGILEVLGSGLGDALLWADSARHVLGCNDLALELLGYSANELIGKSLADIFPAGLPEEFSILGAALGRRQFSTTLKNNRCEAQCKCGRVLALDVVVTSLSDVGSDQATLVLILRGSLAKERERNSGASLTHRIHCSLIGIYILQDGKFMFTNPQLQRDSGFDERELADIVPLSRVHPEDRDMVRRSGVEMLKGKRSSGYVFRVINRDGEIRYVHETVSSIIYNGKAAVLGSLRDITEGDEMNII